MIKKIKRILLPFGLIFLYLVAQELTGLIVSTYKGNFVMQNVILITGSILVTIALIIVFRKDLKVKVKEFRQDVNEIIPTCFKYWIIGFGVMFALNMLINVIFTNGIAPNEEANRLLIKSYPIYMALSVCITGPICEELLFRQGFKNIFKGRIPYILFTGILFGAAHAISSEQLIDLIYILSYSCLGIAFSTICYDADNVCASIFTHMFHNTIMFILLLSIL